jgi:hypothetical protein
MVYQLRIESFVFVGDSYRRAKKSKLLILIGYSWIRKKLASLVAGCVLREEQNAQVATRTPATLT